MASSNGRHCDFALEERRLVAMECLVPRCISEGPSQQTVVRILSRLLTAYEKGAISLIEVLQAYECLLRASDARVQAQTESARAAIAAFKALGGAWQP